MNTTLSRGQPARKPMTRSSWWALGLLAATVPVLLLAVAVIEAVASALGMGMGTPSTPAEVDAQTWLNLGFFVVVAAPMVASAVVGVRAWLRAKDAVALTVGLISAAMLAGGATMAVVSRL